MPPPHHLQLTYSMTRFAVYEVVKNEVANRSRDASGKSQPLSFLQKAMLAGVSGLAGGVVGNPADLINVRSRACAYMLLLNEFLKVCELSPLALMIFLCTVQYYCTSASYMSREYSYTISPLAHLA